MDTYSSISPTASIESLTIFLEPAQHIVSFPDYIFGTTRKEFVVWACSTRLCCTFVSQRMTSQARHGAGPRFLVWSRACRPWGKSRDHYEVSSAWQLNIIREGVSYWGSHSQIVRVGRSAVWSLTTTFCQNCSLELSPAITLRESGEHCSQVRSHITISIVQTHCKALRMKISYGY